MEWGILGGIDRSREGRVEERKGAVGRKNCVGMVGSEEGKKEK